MSNLATRVVVAAVAIPLIVAAAYFGGVYFFLFTTTLIIVSTNEFYFLAKKKNMDPSMIAGITCAGVLNAFAYSSGINVVLDFLIFAIVFILLWELGRKRTDGVRGTFENVGTTLTGVIYIGLFGAMLTLIRQPNGIGGINPDDRSAGLFIIMILSSIWICDSAAYFVGKWIGKHKMSKFVSPNKSWEGAAAGFIFAVATTVAARIIVLPQLNLKLAVGTGIVVGVAGQAGDFVESMFKRDSNVKDSSEIIPGHGGVLDRFDSLLMSAPLIYLMLKYLR